MEIFNQFHGYFLQDPWFIVGSLVVIAAVGYLGLPLIIWTLALAAVLIGFGAPIPLLIGFGVFAVIFNIKPIRANLISRPVMGVMKGILPKISDTERTALEAGVVWVEGDLFSGKPNFKKILEEPYPDLTKEEQEFIDGPVEELCSIIDDWEVWKKREVQQEAWDYIKEKKFLGMIIPKEYGGLGFSAAAHSAVIHKLSSRSLATSISVMVPNSLGPAELLNHYGTEEQKKHYLPRLAAGQEMPCFALTEPTAGSDAGSLTSVGVLFKDTDGELKIRLSWNKRWITLAAISSILGMAFRLKDPENLLGRGEDVGITCALIPSNTPGVVLGRRHDPLHLPFYNCPTQGKDVVISANQIIGGIERAGDGWLMLMESLAAGRGISLPGQSAGGTKLVTRVASAHASIRKQFGVAIGKFEGIEEPMARIAGINYILEAMRKFTVGSIDKGLKPPVITAMAKYNATDLSRMVINDGMDILGGAGISLGPRNLLGITYMATPIGITVEGANILTRTLMIFGQGALRAHPYAFKEVAAVEKNDLNAFDSAFWGHIGHIVTNGFRAVLLSVTRGHLAGSPVGGPVAKYYRRLSWSSAAFALLSDIAMGSLGGALKMKEMITGRYADILSWMYMSTCVLRRWEADGRRKEDLPFVHWAMAYSFHKQQEAFDGILKNLPVPGLGWLFKGILAPWSRFNSFGAAVPDHLTSKISQLIQADSEQRERLTELIYVPTNREDQLGRLEYAFRVVKKAEAAEKKIKKAIKSKKLPKKKVGQLLEEALSAGVITSEEQGLLKEAELVRFDAVQVDDFDESEYKSVENTSSQITGSQIIEGGSLKNVALK